MKTLKTIITATVMLFALTSTQQTQAQTKEETLEWLQINGNNYLQNDVECNWSDGSSKYYSYIYSFTEDSIILNHNKNKIFYKDVLFVSDISQLDEEEITGKGYCTDYLLIYINTNSGKKAFNIKNNQKSRENAHRALKAIMHMAKLSGAKENKQIF